MQHDATKNEVPLFKLHNTKRGVLGHGDVVANVQQVPATLMQVDTSVNVYPVTDARTQDSQRQALQLGPGQQGPRDGPRGLHDDPVADIEVPPHRHSRRPVRPDEPTFERPGQEERQHRVRSQSNKAKQRGQQDQHHRAQPLADPGQQGKGQPIGIGTSQCQFQHQPGALDHGGGDGVAWVTGKLRRLHRRIGRQGC